MLITLKDNLHFKIEPKDREYLKEVKEYFTEFTEGHEYSPKFQAGIWDGTISLFDSRSRALPFGLLTDFLSFHKRYHSEPIEVSPEVKSLFKSVFNKEIRFLNLKPHPYQKICIETFLKYSKGVQLIGTGGGKSYIIACILYNLHFYKYVKKSLLIVPTQNLITQFYSDLEEYEIPYSLGKVYSKEKSWDKNIVISTWQALKNNKAKLKEFESIFVDEVHGVKATVLLDIVKNTPHISWRYGCTGTLPETRLDNLNVKSYLGPKLNTYDSKYLIKKGYLALCNINLFTISYNDSYKGSWNEIKEEIFKNPYRLTLLKKIVEEVDDTILLLVGRVEIEGKILESYFKKQDFENCEINFISGETDIEERELWRQKCINSKKKTILIATYPLFKMGINIPNLTHVVLASPFKSKILVLQSIGRALRKHSIKTKGAQIYDIIDTVPIIEKHGRIRLEYYKEQDFVINETLLNEEIIEDNNSIIENLLLQPRR